MFKDSLQHLPTSLASLVDGLEGNTPYMKGEYPDHYQLLARKGVYLYEYMTSFEKFNETQLPPIEAFASSLNNGARGLRACAARMEGYGNQNTGGLS